MLFNIIPDELIARKNETELVVYFKNGSIYQLKGSDDPEALRGPNPMGVIFDEFDTQKINAWGIIEPILRANGGWAWFIGTPRGKTNLFDLYHRGQKGDPEWRSWLVKASESNIIAPEQLEAAQKSMPEDLYNQEFECAFNDASGSVFRGVKEIMVSRPVGPLKDHIYVMGVDLAKVQDWTVIRVYDRDTNALVFKDRMQTLDWPFQKSKIIAIAKHYNNALCIVDATGVGDPIADDLTRAGVGVIPFKITQITKREIIEKLASWVQLKRFKLLPDEEALLEYDNFTYKIGPLGSIRYEGRVGFHDDIVMADALAVWHLNPVFMPEQMREPTPTQIAFMRAKNQYANDQLPIEEQTDPLGDPEWASVEQDLEGSGY